MATDDITTQLIDMMGASGQANTVAANSSLVGSGGDLLSTMANYVQILSTVEGPAAQAAAASEVGNFAAQQAAAQLEAGAAAESQAAAAAAVGTAAEESAVAVAGASLAFAVVLVAVAFILADLSSQGQSSDESQQFMAALNAVKSDVDQHALEQYWEVLFTGTLSTFWADVGADLDNLAAEGTGGTDVKNGQNSYVNFHDHGMKFVNLLISDPASPLYWQVPPQYAGDVPQSASSPSPDWGRIGWEYYSWYGQFPTRPTVEDSPGGNVSDPRTMLPMLVLGLRSYLTLESMLNFIDSTQPTLLEFLNQYRGDPANWLNQPFSLSYYTNFLFTKYSEAVNGIVKTDLPTQEEILGALWWVAQIGNVFAHPSTNPGQPTSQSWGAPWRFPNGGPVQSYSGNGWAWNLRLGASETYPQYGSYGNYQIDASQQNVFTQAYIVSHVDTTGAVSDWQHANILFNSGGETYVSIDSLQNWAIPWLQNRLILGRMARWKAIYLINGFDRAWNVLQAMQRLVAPNGPIVPSTMKLTQDNTIATGNWSVRELCEVLLPMGDPQAIAEPDFVINWAPASPTVWASFSGHSVAELAQFLYNVGFGNWAGPPTIAPTGLSLREWLSAGGFGLLAFGVIV
jgi:hypothetical protein